MDWHLPDNKTNRHADGRQTEAAADEQPADLAGRGAECDADSDLARPPEASKLLFQLRVAAARTERPEQPHEPLAQGSLDEPRGKPYAGNPHVRFDEGLLGRTSGRRSGVYSTVNLWFQEDTVYERTSR